MKIALYTSESEEHLAFVRSLGLTDVVCGMPADIDGVVPVESFERRRDLFSRHELDWGVIENLTPTLYDEIMLGTPERERQLDGVCRTIENVGKAGIPVPQYQWILLGGLRTEYSPTGPSGARYPRFDSEVARHMAAACLDWLGGGRHRYPHVPDRPLSSEEVWANLEWFLKALVPVVESAGVRLAAHPDDAPVPEYLGVARILIDVDSRQRIIDIVPSPNNGIGFCMGDIDIIAAVRFEGGDRPLGDGPLNAAACVTAVAAAGYDGLVRAGTAALLATDDDWNPKGAANDLGYLRAVLQTLDSQG